MFGQAVYVRDIISNKENLEGRNSLFTIMKRDFVNISRESGSIL